MKATPRALVVWLALVPLARAQDLGPDLAAADAKIAAREWQDALRLLLDLRVRATTAEGTHSVADALDRLTMAALRRAAFAPALQAGEAALAARTQACAGKDDARIAAACNNLGGCLMESGRAADALVQFEAALAMQRRLLGDADDEEIALSLNNFAMCLRALGRQAEALDRLEETLAMRKRIHGDADHANVALSLNNVAGALRRCGRAAQALPLLEQALAMRRRLHGEEHAAVAESLNNLAHCLDALGRTPEALAPYEASLALRKRLHEGRDHPQVAVGLGSVAGCLQALGRASEALSLLQEALAMRQRLHGGGDHPELAAVMQKVGSCLRELGRLQEALSIAEASLAMRRRLHRGRDHPDLAFGLDSVGGCLRELGRPAEALTRYEESLAMRKRIHGERDHADVAVALNGVAVCLRGLGRASDALPLLEESLAMRRRLHGDCDHAEVATALHNLAVCLQDAGRSVRALTLAEQALAMRRRMFGERDHPDVAAALVTIAVCMRQLGRPLDALGEQQGALAMQRRLHGDRDHPDVADALMGLAIVHDALGRPGDALPRYHDALAMLRRLHGERDHPEVARAHSNLAACVDSLGRVAEAQPQHEASLAMFERLSAGADHPDVARGLGFVAHGLRSLGQAAAALPRYEAALAMERRLRAGTDHPGLAVAMSNLASCLRVLGRLDEALPMLEAALAMSKRLYGDRDVTTVVHCLHNLGVCLRALGRNEEALARYGQAMAMRQRQFGGSDHPSIATGMCVEAVCLHALGRTDEAIAMFDRGLAIIERIRDSTRLSDELRQALFDDLKRDGPFERLQGCCLERGDSAAAFLVSERSRSRGLLDLVEQQRFDPMVEAVRRATLRGDAAAVRQLERVQADLRADELERDRLLHLLTRLADDPNAAQDLPAARAELLLQSDAANARHRLLLDERARLLGDVLPVGHVRTVAEIQTALAPGEVLLQFTVTKVASMVYVLTRDDPVAAFALPAAHATVERVLPGLLQRASGVPQARRGRDPEGPVGDLASSSVELFASLVPPAVWQRVRAATRVFIAPHRSLHRLPFESLVTSVDGGSPVPWLAAGPPIAYVPSGSVLHWLRRRARDAADDRTGLDLLAVGDPRRAAAAEAPPEHGVHVVAVQPEGAGSRAGLRPGDVLLRYDGQPLADDRELRDRGASIAAAIEDGKRAKAPISLELWRRGETIVVEVAAGRLGIEVEALAPAAARDASPALVLRGGELERLATLPPLREARAETAAIARVFVDAEKPSQTLLGEAATEPVVFDLAARAKHVHFACHGIAEECAGWSLSVLVLSQPERVLPNDDGLLMLDDLLSQWRGRLSSCRLVVLSACRTNVGPTQRDEAPQALPIGFFFAGVPSVISSLWAVDDQSTRELMTDFYGRLLAGETDKLKALVDAKKALRAKYPDPFHWAPFLFLGAPE